MKIHLLITNKGIHGAASNKAKWNNMLAGLARIRIPKGQLARSKNFRSWDCRLGFNDVDSTQAIIATSLGFSFVAIQTLEKNELIKTPGE